MDSNKPNQAVLLKSSAHHMQTNQAMQINTVFHWMDFERVFYTKLHSSCCFGSLSGLTLLSVCDDTTWKHAALCA